MRQVALLIALVTFLVPGLSAQTSGFTVSGRVHLSQDTPAQSANVSLLLAKDSSVVKVELASIEGAYKFTGVRGGTYLISAMFSGYRKSVTEPFTLSADYTAPVILLQVISKELNTITVSARRPIIEQKFDKLIFNVSDNITAAGNSALEVLEKAPGVVVTHSGAISLGGRAGVLVMIDGKRTHLSEADLAAYLRGLPASAIDRIELVSNPSAQYEAEGTSGIIDIRLKKDERMGYNGSLSLALIYGTHVSGNGSTNFNYRNKKLNIFGTVSKSHNSLQGKQSTVRTFFTNNRQYNGSIHTANDRHFEFNNNNVRIGADYFLSRKTVIGVIAMGTFSSNIVDYITKTENFYLNDSADFSIDRSLNQVRRRNGAFNFNIKHTIDSGGKEWSFDVDYAPFRNNDQVDLRANFFNKNSIPSSQPYYLDGDLSGTLDVFSSRFDLHLPNVFAGKLQVGARSSLVKAINGLVFYDRSSATPVLDVSKSNEFFYDEHINALYANYQRMKKRWSLEGGLRLENTNGKGKQVTSSQQFSRSYMQLFPTIYTGYEVSKQFTLGVSFSRRINRPSYSQLNPFRFYASPFGYSEGNPMLNPPLTYVAEMSGTFFKNYIARFSYAITEDIISMTWGFDAFDRRISAQRPLNLSSSKTYRLSVTGPVRFKNWFTSFNNIATALTSFEGDALNTVLDKSLPWFFISSNNTFRITKTFTAELNAGYRSAQLSGFQRMVAASAVAVGFGKQVMGGKGNLRFNVSDIFRTAVGHGVTTLTNYELRVKQWDETRRGTISFSYNFGKTKVAAARNRTLSADDERARAAN